MKEIKDLDTQRDTHAHGLEDIFLKITQPNVKTYCIAPLIRTVRCWQGNGTH